MNTTTCPDCGISYTFGASPFCRDRHEAYSAVKQPAVTYPGGLRLMNMGVPGETIVYSEQERRDIMKARGLREGVWHIPAPGGDSSPVTTSWASVDLEAAAALVNRVADAKATKVDGSLETLRVGFEYNPVRAVFRA